MKITVKNTSERDVDVAKNRVLAELSHTAAAPRKQKPVAAEPDRKKYPSRFFFTISNSEHDEIERRKKKFKPRAVVHDDSHITGRLKTYKHQLPERMKLLEDRFREFWLNEIVPRTLASETATNQAKEIVQRSAGVANIDVPAAMVSSLMGRALELRMARFIKDYMRLNAAEPVPGPPGNL